MPGIEIAGTSPASPEHPDRLLLKAHKSLPRRANPILQDAQIPQLSSPAQNGHSDVLSFTPVPVLPLTPPGIIHDESPTGTAMQKVAVSSHSVVGVLTPSKPSHPPTPETTPPRVTGSNRLGMDRFGYISSSSQAESFQTAFETISDAETEIPRRPSPPSFSRSTTPTWSRQSDIRDHSDARLSQETLHENNPPANSRNSSQSEISTEKFAEGNGGSSPITIPRRRERSNSQGSDRRANFTQDASKRSREVTDIDLLDSEAPMRGRRDLRERVNQVQKPDDNATMDLFRKQIGWPEDQLGPVEPEDLRRFSGVSTSSTVEAMIIDTPQPARRLLRHTEKRLSLRSASSPITKSERISIASSSDIQRRLSHKVARITENDRRSVVSEISMSGSSTLRVRQQPVDVVPVVVIPQRHSSLRASSSSASRNTSKTRSRPPSGHAPTLSNSRARSLDLPRHRKRTLSDPHASIITQAADLRGRGFSRPYIPPRSSSLSAPTSQNNSRTTSLTSESLRSHNLAIELEMRRQAPQPPKPSLVLDTGEQDKLDATEVPNTQSILIGVEDIAHLRPPSVPFTQYSIPSSSPGPFEIDEARTVAIFPHNNESLLLVDPQVQPGLRGQMPSVNHHPEPDLPRTPEPTQQREAFVDSPLKNPRPPPQPPISATAAPPHPQDDAEWVFEDPKREPQPTDLPARRFASKRRGWIPRPRSESFYSFVRSLSLASAKNPKAGQDIDGRIQPFWRPHRFWDDSPEAEPESPEEVLRGQVQPTEQSDQVISNSLGMPHKRIVFKGPALSPQHRQGAKRRIDGSMPYYHANRSSLVGSRIFSPEALYSQTSLHQRQFPTVSWWRLRFRTGTVRSLRRRLRRSIQRRAEGRREARREKLKQSIGEAVLVNSST